MKFPLFVGFGVVSIVLAPFIFSEEKLLFGTFPDSWVFLWNLKRLAAVWSGEEALYYTNWIYTPTGTSLALHTQAEAVLLPLAPLQHVIGLSATYNLAVLLCFLGNFAGFFALFLLLSKRPWLSLLFSLLLTFHPFFLGHLAGGHINFLLFFPVLFALRSILSLLFPPKSSEHRSERKELLTVALAVGFTAYANLYFLYFLALLMVLLVVLAWCSHPSHESLSRSVRLMLAFGGGLLFATPKLWRVVESYRSGSFAPDHDPLSHRADLLYLFLPTEHHLTTQLLKLSPPSYIPGLSHVEIGVFCGVSLFCLVVTLFLCSKESERPLPRKVFLLGALVFGVLSLGTVLSIAGEEFGTIPLMSSLSALPFYPSVPIRFGFFPVLFLFCFVAQELRSYPLNRSLLISGLLFFVVLEHLPGKLPVSAPPYSDAVAQLRSEPHIRTVIDLARGRQHKLLRQIQHEKKITSAFVARAPKVLHSRYQENPFLQYLRRGEAYEPHELRVAIESLEIDAVICESGKPRCMQRVQETELFQELARDWQFVVFVRRPPINS
ncbi:hypothetical protein MRY87_11390 [bacterium]|nr:hypothetical protein [bacterium]